MNCKKLMVLLLALVMCAGVLAACKGIGNGKETKTETETTPLTPQYDYLGSLVSQYVTIDKSVYADMTLTVPDYYKIEKEDVDDYIAYICFENRTATNGTTESKDIEVSYGDDAFIYYKGLLNGEAFEGGSNWDEEKPYQLGIGSQSFIPGFEDGLIGVIPENTSKDNPYELKVTFPESYGTESLAGKEVTFLVAITHTVRYDVPEYTIDFIEKTLKYEFKKEFYASDSVKFEEFEAYVWEDMIASNESELDTVKSDALWAYLIGKATFTFLPETEVEIYYNNYVSEMQSIYDYYAASSENGEKFVTAYPTVDDFVPVYMGLEKGVDWKAEMKKRAEDVVKRKMVGHAIGEMEGLETISEVEYNAQIKYWAEQYKDYGMTEADVVASMGQANLNELAFAEKIETWLLARATFIYESDAAAAETETETA